MKLIPKDAVLAEIEKLHNQHISPNYVDEAGLVLEQLEDNICSLEVKEVDLKKEIQTQWKGCAPIDEGMGCEFANISVEQFKGIAKYFFELGVNASNPLTWEDIRIIGKLRLDIALELRRKELESPDFIKFTEEDYCNEVLKRYKAQKGEKI